MEINENIDNSSFLNREPFDHIVINDFVNEELGLILSNEFPDYKSADWYAYDNPLENKKTIREWGKFPSVTYQFFMYLCSENFVNELRKLTGVDDLIPDIGLHGAGWHMSGSGSHLNIHQDYSIHPFANLQRKYNLILYLTPDWDPKWGGGLEFWSHDENTEQPLHKEILIDNIFRRAVLFDTTQNSWHGYPDKITCPPNVHRKSIAMYYLSKPSETARKHKRALYSPNESQKDDQEVIDLIQKRVLL